ncbi:MAG: hypothetical protein RSE32_14285 [Comamonas sp.]|uniref:hypothetical protein n=1 Tax=Comamonas sp. TaxID=34028 RepID=UPI002FCBAF54
MNHATIDFETYSEAGYEWSDALNKWVPPEGGSATNRGLSLVGVVNYTRHPSFEVLCCWYKLPGGELTYWDPSMPPPQELFDYIAAGGIVEAHNHAFEHRVFQALGWPEVPLAQQRCSMAKSRAWALPGSLDLAAATLGTTPKNPDGKKGIQLFSVPRQPTKTNPARRNAPTGEQFQKLIVDYCRDDVISEESLSAVVPELSPIELEHWQVDQTVNRRGVAVDVPTLYAMRVILRDAHRLYGDRCREITDGISPSEVSQLIIWAANRGVLLAALDDEAITEALGRENLPEPVRQMLQCRQAVASASVKKIHAMLNRATTEGRIYDLFNFHAARTGRPTGDAVQPTNFPRGSLAVNKCGCGRYFAASACGWCGAPAAGAPTEWNPDAMHDAIEVAQTGSLALMEHAFGAGNTLSALAGCLRGMFVAGEGRDLVSSDYTAIEAVVLACLAGEQWRIDLFHNKGKIYEASGAKVGGVSYESLLEYKKETGKNHPLRQVGKTCLSPDTQVLTDAGWMAIVDVSINHSLWDGQEWVTHSGLIHQGRKQVISLDGVKMTPDHRIFCDGSWKEAKQVASCASTLSQALATGSGSLQSCAQTSPSMAVCGALSSSAIVELQSIVSTFTISGAERQPDAMRAQNSKAQTREKSFTGCTPTQCRTTNTAGGCSTVWPQLSGVAITRETKPMRTTGGVVLRFTTSGAPTDLSFCTTSAPCQGGIDQNLTWTESIATGTMSPETCDSSAGQKTTSTKEACKTCSDESMNWSDVYDIANAGPRTRFTIKTDSGAMIVHNCELALGYGGWVGGWLAFDDSGRTEDEIKKIILAWRDASPAVVEFWGGQVRRGRGWKDELFGVEGAFIRAALLPGVPVHYRGLVFEASKSPFPVRCPAASLSEPCTVQITLMSGRKLTYHNVLLEPMPASRSWAGRYSISYEGFNTNPKSGARGWIRIATYGPKIVENLVQATANDILRYAMVNLERAGYPVVLHVYDEIVCEVPKGFGSVEELESIMKTLPSWAAGWPIGADGGWRGRRYRKG